MKGQGKRQSVKPVKEVMAVLGCDPVNPFLLLPALYQSFGSGGCHTQALPKLGIAMLNLDGLVMNEHWSEPSTGLILGSISG